MWYYFSDPDGDRLTYRARSSDSRSTVEVHVAPRVPYRLVKGYDLERVPHLTVTYAEAVTGNDNNYDTTVTVTATDPRGLSASLEIPFRIFNVAEGSDNCDVTPLPSFGDATIAHRSWPANKAIVPVTLPLATGGVAGGLTYSLVPTVPGLTFDAATRTLSGTPTTVAAATAMTYEALDSRPSGAYLYFDITITDTAVGANPPTSASFAVMIDEDTSHTFAADQFPFNDEDPDEHLHELRIDSLPASGTLLLNDVEQAADATIARADLSALQYRPPADWYGIASFRFKVVDTTQRASTQAYTATVTVRPVDDTPTSADFERTVAEDTALTLTSTDFAFSDADAHARGAVIIASLPDAAAGTLALDGTAVSAGQKIPAPSDFIDGTLQFTPAANWAGTATFQFGVEDTTGAGSLVSNTATIRVTAVNDAPETADLTRSLDEDATLTLTVADFTFDDVDEGDRLKAIVFTQAPQSGEPAQPAGTLSSFHGSVETVIEAGDTVAAAGLTRLEYRPDPEFSGRVTFTFQVQDHADAVSEAATGTVQVVPVADPPTSEGFTIAGDEDTAVTVAAANFVFRDLDPGDSLKAVVVVTVPDAAHGALEVKEDAVKAGNVIAANDLDIMAFAPAPDWFGNARFTFRVVDQSGTRSAAAYTAIISIVPKNDAPTAANFTRKWTPDLDFQAAFESAFADPDPNDRLRAVRLAGQPSGGSVWHYGKEQASGAVIKAAELSELEFRPSGGVYRAGIHYQVQDLAKAVSEKSYTLALWRNTPPTAQALSLTTREDRPLPLAASDFDGAFTDADDGDSLTAVTIGSVPARGTLTLDGAVTSAGQIVAREDLAGLTFTPAPDYAGAARFSFRVHDRENETSDAAWATVTVIPVADAPVAAALNLSTAEDTVLAFTAAQFEGVFGDADEDDSLKSVRVVTLPDAGHGALVLNGTAVAANRIVAHGDLGNLTFWPAANWNGEAQIYFRVGDQTERFSAPSLLRITVTAVADAPVAAALNVSTPESTALAFTAADFEAVFHDADAGDSLKAVKVASLPDAAYGVLALQPQAGDRGEEPGDHEPGRGQRPDSPIRAVTVDQVIGKADLGTLTFTPVKNFAARTSFTFQVVDQSDRASAAAVATIVVVGDADPPVAAALNVSTAEDMALTFTAADFEGVFSDPDVGDSLKAVQVVSLPDAAHGALALSGTAVTANRKVAHGDLGSLVFTPVGDWNGTARFTFKVVDQSDAASAAAAAATITVRAVPDAPVAGALGVSTTEETALSFTAANFEEVYTDADGDALKAVKVVSLPAATEGELTLSGPAVTPTEGAPTLSGPAVSLPVVTEGAPALSVMADQTIVKADLGSLKFTPVRNFAGEATFTFKVVDDTDAESAVVTATVTVTGTNDAPAASALGVSTSEDAALSFTAAHFEGVFSDPDAGDSLKAVRVVSLPAAAHGALALNETAVTANRKIVKADLEELKFTPVKNFAGTARFTFKVVDQSDAESAAATATITVSGTNDAPKAAALGVSTSEDAALTFTAAHFEGVFSDPDAGDSLKAVQVVSLPTAAHGALALSETAVTANRKIVKADLGKLKFTPVKNFAGKATFTFKVVDDTDAESAAATATITVSAVNDAPAASALNVSTAEDTALTFTAAQFEGAFSDPDSDDSLKAVQVASLPASTAGALALDGTAVTANREVAHGDLGKLTFTPVGDFERARRRSRSRWWTSRTRHPRRRRRRSRWTRWPTRRWRARWA